MHKHRGDEAIADARAQKDGSMAGILFRHRAVPHMLCERDCFALLLRISARNDARGTGPGCWTSVVRVQDVGPLLRTLTLW